MEQKKDNIGSLLLSMFLKDSTKGGELNMCIHFDFLLKPQSGKGIMKR